VSYAIHLLFAGLWAGGAALFAWGVVPLAGDSTIGVEPAESLAGTFVTVSRVSALATLLTGWHMAATVYGVDGLTAGTRGYLVIAMVVLWLALAALSEVGVSRFRDALDRRKVRTAAADARPFLLGASLTGIALLIVGGYLAA
jgi:hypothetical protein